jgi:hypothetical protein
MIQVAMALVAVVIAAGGAGAQAPVGSEFQVNTHTTAAQMRVDADSDAAGNFVVVWTSDGQDGDKTGAARRAERPGQTEPRCGRSEIPMPRRVPVPD